MGQGQPPSQQPPSGQPSSQQPPSGQPPSRQPPSQQFQSQQQQAPRGQRQGQPRSQPPTQGQRTQQPSGGGPTASPQQSLGRGQSQQMGGGPGMQAQQTPGMQSQQPQQSSGMQQQVQMQPVKIEEIVQTDVVTADPDTGINEVLSMMAEEDVGSVVVVEDGTPIGVLTDRKIALALADGGEIEQIQAEDLVQDQDPVTASTDMTLLEALQQLNDENIRRLPVVNEDGELEGILTLDDVLVLFGNALNRATGVIEAQSPRL